jgi:pilus assembly protein HofM
MTFHRWQVGLEIGHGTLRALAVQRRRQGWRLRHWWQQTLPEDALIHGEGLPPAGVGRLLARWRKQLPGSISLRICLPVSLMAQRRMKAPDGRLREPERGWYIASQARRHFQDDKQALLFDYRDDPLLPQTLLVTAARQGAIAQWQACLNAAGLDPQIMDFMPCALRCLARYAGLDADKMLIHELGDGWCWVSPLSCPLEFGFIPRPAAADFLAARLLINQQYSHGTLIAGPVAYFSSVLRAVAPINTLAWPPLDSLWLSYPPVPPWLPAFVVAGGLALRHEDE